MLAWNYEKDGEDNKKWEAWWELLRDKIEFYKVSFENFDCQLSRSERNIHWMLVEKKDEGVRKSSRIL
jgi:3-phenylpropionate/cinnamic acid dioxygenase small subunit